MIALTIAVAGLSVAPPREPMDEAIDRGLAYLRRSQRNDGGWATSGGDNFGAFGGAIAGGSDPAVTALAVMAFLSAGHVPGEGRHGAAIEAGVRFVAASQQRNGVFALQWGGHLEMYYHGICTLMLAEVAGMTDGKLAEEIRQRMEAAVRVILVAQKTNHGRETGGWRYTVGSHDSDLSVTGWQIMALRGAKNLGCDVPKERIKLAVDYIQRCHDPNTGGYRYTTSNQVTVACTGTGVLALELCGKEYHRSPEAQRAGNYILNSRVPHGQAHFFYGVYYTSQAMFQLGDNYWNQYRGMLHNALLRQTPPRQDGSWIGRGFDDNRYGPNYCTAMAILALTVEYRFLPIYQRFEEPIERDARDDK
jgi:Squalene-hopene cyclase C-terminal domain